MTVKEVVEIFQRDKSLLALPIAKDDLFIGMISRKNLFSLHLGRPFALDLYAKKPIELLLNEQTISVPADLDINQALTALLKADPSLESDSMAVLDQGRCIGILPVADLMMKISDNQARLLAELDRLSCRIREEVATASRIQQDLLPPSEVKFGNLAISAGVTTSSEIGGDFYDYLVFDDGRVVLVVADVSGHGVQSGMVTTAAKASLHTLIAEGARAPAELLYGMNNAILATARQSLLMTCLVALVDLKEEKITLANAGHNYPYLHCCVTDEVAMVETIDGYPLGFEAGCRFRETTIPFVQGDKLVLYTDGLVECVDVYGNELGYERVNRLIAANSHAEAVELRTRMMDYAAQFSGSNSFSDDVTLLVAKYNDCAGSTLQAIGS